jgi:hypothetical protein
MKLLGSKAKQRKKSRPVRQKDRAVGENKKEEKLYEK